jgi:hypothetical protein
MQGAAFGGAKGKPEDAEMRSATRVIQVCGVVGSSSQRYAADVAESDDDVAPGSRVTGGASPR